MFLSILNWLRDFWRDGDLKSSDRLVRGLLIPDQTKEFVFAIRVPETQSVVYLLATHSLSRQSALDVELLIKAVQPDVVVVEVPFQEEQIPIPTSYFGVLKKCFINKTTIQQYKNIAAGQFLEEIFGIGLSGNVLSAKRAASEFNSTFLPFRMTNPPISFSSNFVQWLEPEEFNLRSNYEVPSFAQSVYPLFTDLHDLVMDDLPAIGNALADTQKMLADVNEGLPVDIKLLSELHNFEIALELSRIALNNDARSHANKMRIALNNVARFPVNKMIRVQSPNVEFSEEEMANVILANALKSQARKVKSIVAIVNASSLAGIRKHWNTPVTQKIEQLADRYFTEIKGTVLPWWMEVLFLFHKIDKHVMTVGAGASLLGASALTKLLRRSTWTDSAKEKSFELMKTSFYEIRRRHNRRPAGFRLWAIFGCSVVTYAGPVVCRDRVNCVLESADEAPRIARLGRGLRSLHSASQEVRQSSTGAKIQETIKSLKKSVEK